MKVCVIIIITIMSSSSSNSQIYARFVPDVTSISHSKGPPLLSSTSPIIVSALNAAFPAILIINSVLSILTWTNENKSSNFLFLLVYITVVKYWNILGVLFFPLLLCFSFCCFYWGIKVILEDTGPGSTSPTLEEIIDTLTNMSIRLRLLVKPILDIKKADSDSLWRLLITATLLTPVYISLMKFLFSPTSFCIFWGTFIFTYHSMWFIAIRKLLWRSVYIRKGTSFLTGLDISTLDKSSDIVRMTDLKVLNAGNSTTSRLDHSAPPLPTRADTNTRKIVEFQIFENQRRWLGFGWTEYTLPNERVQFTDADLKPCDGIDAFKFPTIPELAKIDHKWTWFDESWKVDKSFNKEQDPDGWVYYNNNWEFPEYEDNVGKFTRSRKLVRRALLVVDNNQTI